MWFTRWQQTSFLTLRMPNGYYSTKMAAPCVTGVRTALKGKTRINKISHVPFNVTFSSAKPATVSFVSTLLFGVFFLPSLDFTGDFLIPLSRKAHDWTILLSCRFAPYSAPVAPDAEEPNPGSASVSACRPCCRPVQLQDGAAQRSRGSARHPEGRWGREGGGARGPRVHTQEKGKEPHDQDWLCLVNLFIPVIFTSNNGLQRFCSEQKRPKPHLPEWILINM